VTARPSFAALLRECLGTDASDGCRGHRWRHAMQDAAFVIFRWPPDAREERGQPAPLLS